MDSSPIPSASLAVSPTHGLLASVSSVLATVCLLALLPVLYLGVDLLDHKGRIPISADAEAVVRDRVSPAAAEALGQQPVGVLATVARLQNNWASYPVGLFARWNKWAWTNEGLLAELLLLAVGLLLLRGLFLNAASHTACSTAIDAAQRLRRHVYNHCYRLGVLATQPELQGETGTLITDRVEAMQDGWIAGRTTFVRTAVLMVAAIVVMLVVNVWLGLAVLCLGGLVWLVAGQSAAWFRRDARVAERRAATRMGVLRESLRLMLVVKCNLMERFNQARAERLLTDLSKTAKRQYRGETLSRPTLYTVAAVTAMVLLYLAGRVILNGQASPAAVAVLGVATIALAVAATRWTAARVQMRKGRIAAADVAEFLDRRTDSGQAIDAEFLQPLTKKLDLVEVSYREPGTGRMILEGVSMSVPAGDRAAVLFSDPDEARTLAFLLTRFLDPTAGEVRFDGKNTRWVTFESIRTQVALVLPDHTTFTDTVTNNIGCGDTFTLPQIVEAAKAAHAHGFVQRMPYGYETLIGDGGFSLRPGERFRVALARAILRDPAVLIVEEPAEPFDPDSTALIDDAINRLSSTCTVVFLARRASTVRRADRVFVIHNGKMAVGDHDTPVSGSFVHKAMHARRPPTEAGSM